MIVDSIFFCWLVRLGRTQRSGCRPPGKVNQMANDRDKLDVGALFFSLGFVC